jgi:hypothetical protein
MEAHSNFENVDPDLPAARSLPVDLETIVEIATEDEFYPDDEYARTGYVDTVTGEVHVVYRDALSCANGELELDELSEWSADCVEVAGKILSDIEDRYVEIERWHSSEGYDLMVEFASEARDPRVRDRLSDALRGKKPFRRFKDTLFEWPEVREAWFAFQGHAQRDSARDWLRGFGIEAVDASLYKLPPAPDHW